MSKVWQPPQTNWAISVPGGGTAVTALQTAQHTEVAPTGYSKRFRHPEHTSWLCAPLAGGVYGAGAGVGYGASGTGIIKSQRVTLFSS